MVNNFISALSIGVLVFGGIIGIIILLALINAAGECLEYTMGPWGRIFVCFAIIVAIIFIMISMVRVRSKEETYITNIVVTKIGDQYNVTDSDTGEPIQYTFVRYVSNEKLKEPRIKEIRALNDFDKVILSGSVLEIPVEEEYITGEDRGITSESVSQ